MSTRATYRFILPGFTPSLEVTCYIHHDGYLKGAAEYFLAACQHPARKGGMVSAFISANDNAEITAGHAYHGDTEYRYDLTDRRLRAHHRPIDSTSRSWRLAFDGDLLDFIRHYEGTHLILAHGLYLNRGQAGNLLVQTLQQAEDAQARGWTGNSSSYTDQAWKLHLQIKAAYGDQVEGAAARIEALDRAHCSAYGWAEQLHETEGSAYERWVKNFRTEVNADEPS